MSNGSCPDCGLVASSLGEGDLGVAIDEEARPWDELFTRLGDAPSFLALPAPGVRSALAEAEVAVSQRVLAIQIDVMKERSAAPA